MPEYINQKVWIDYNISSKIFKSTKTEKIKTNLNIKSNGRRLDNEPKTKTINSEILFDIYENENDLIKAYVIILSREEFLDEKKIKSFNDTTKKDSNYNAVAKVTFSKNGTIKEQSFSTNSNDVYTEELKDLIAGLIPNLIANENINEKDNIFSVVNNNNNMIALGEDALKGSKADSHLSTNIDNHFAKEFSIQKEFYLKNSDYESDNVQDDENVHVNSSLFNPLETINSLIESVDVTINMNTTFDKNLDEQSVKEHENKLKNIIFTKETSSNGLRLLSKDEYEKNIKLQNEIRKGFNLRNLDTNFTFSLGSPFAFNYEIFKTNMLGCQIAIIANIKWQPSNGLILIELNYVRGTKITKLEPKKNLTFEINNYSDVVVSYKAIIQTIIKYLKEEIISKIDNYNVNISEDQFEIYKTNFQNTLAPLSSLFENYLKKDLDNFKEGVLNYVKSSYQNLFDKIKLYLIPFLNSIENKIKDGSQEEINNLINESKTTVINLINKQNVNLTKLIEDVNNFVNKCVNTISKLKSYQKVGVDFYYRSKEIFKRVDVLIDNYESTLIKSIDTEYLKLKTYVNEKIYLEEMDEYFDDVEIIWDIFNYNEILNQTVLLDHATEIVKQLENVRNRYLKIKDDLLNSVKETYDNLKNNELATSSLNIKALKNDLIAKEENFLNLLKEKSSFIIDYTIYNEDVKKIIEVENEIFNLKINGYQEYIFNKINEISADNFLSSTLLNSLSTDIKNEINYLLNNLKNNKVQNYKNNYENIISIFENLLSASKINEFINEINSKFNSNEVLKYINDYYTYLNDNGLSKFREEADKIINNRLEEYLNTPDELINKIKSFADDEKTDSNVNELNEKISSLIKDKSSNILKDIFSLIENFVRSEINNINNKLPNELFKTKDKINTREDFNSKTNNLLKNLKDNISNYLNYLNSNINIKSKIDEQEKSFNLNIIKVADEIRNKFDIIFCEKEGCKDISFKTMDEYDKYYFQVSKLRDALNHLTLLEPYINDVINDNNLKNLSIDDFINLYKNPLNFDVNTISGKINDLLYKLFKEGIDETQENVDQLKKVIKENFLSNYKNLPEYIFPNFFRTLFNKNDYLDELLNNLINEIIKIIKKGASKDFDDLKKTKFFFNASKTNIEKEFNDTFDIYFKDLNETQQKILNDLDLSEPFKNQIVDKLKEKLETDFNIYISILKNLFSGRTTKNCILLNNNRTLFEILNEAEEEIKKELDENYLYNIQILLDGILKGFRDEIIKKYFNMFNLQFNETYRFYFDSIRNSLQNLSNVESTNEIKNIPKKTINAYEDALNLTLRELKNIINLDDMINYNKNKSDIEYLLQNLFNKFTFKVENNIELSLDENINRLKETCDNELIREEDSFKESLLDYIEDGFNLTVKNFINGPGFSYLDGIFTDDYNNTIVPKLDYILNQCKEIDNYLRLIIDYLFDIDTFLSDSVGEVYYQLMNYINNEITQDKVSAKILKKLLDFKYDSAKEIVKYFKEYTLGILTSESFKNSLSLQVRELIPSNIPLTITLNFTNFYYEFLDSAYLKNIHDIYSTKIVEKRENIIKEIEKLRFERNIQVGMLGMGFSSTLSIEQTEYNKLNASLSEINNDFNFDLSDSKIQNARKLLASDDLKNILKEIHKLYYEDFEYVQNKIISNVSLNVDIDSLYNEINDLFESLNNYDLDYTEFKEDRLEFMNNFTELFEDLENWVYKDYKLQTNSITRLKSIENGVRRRLDENINIEEIQDILNIIDYKITNLTSNIFNSEKLIDLQSIINQITSEINVQLITLKNTLDSYIKYVSFYLTKENLTPYSKKATDIYNTVNDILNDYLKNQSDIFNNILIILEEYSVEYNDNVKPKLINAINNVMKYSSKQLITKYLKSEENNGEENVYLFNKTTDLTNLNGLSTVLGSTRLNFSTNIQNIILKWGHKFVIDPDNYKVFLNIKAGGYADGHIIYHNDYYNTSIAGAFADGQIGMNLTNDFLNGIVYATYYTEYKNSSLEKNLFELTKIDSWDVCEDAVDCFVGKNDDYCPYNLIIENGTPSQFKPDSFDSDYYKNKSIYVFNGYYENNLCTYANYFYGIEESSFEFISALNMTV